MALDSLYLISQPTLSDGRFSADISFDPGHEIFMGHFPEQSVVPGVVLIRIVKDTISRISGRKVKLQKAGNVKFLNIIDPEKTQNVSLSGTMQHDGTGNTTVSASIFLGETTFFRFKGIFS